MHGAHVILYQCASPSLSMMVTTAIDMGSMLTGSVLLAVTENDWSGSTISSSSIIVTFSQTVMPTGSPIMKCSGTFSRPMKSSPSIYVYARHWKTYYRSVLKKKNHIVLVMHIPWCFYFLTGSPARVWKSIAGIYSQCVSNSCKTLTGVHEMYMVEYTSIISLQYDHPHPSGSQQFAYKKFGCYILGNVQQYGLLAIV